MPSRWSTLSTAALTVAFLIDTGWQLPRAVRGEPTPWWGLLLLVPLVGLLAPLVTRRIKEDTSTDSGSHN